MDFSVIVQSAQVRALVQEGALEREFHDALFPGLVFRAECGASIPWPAGVGDTYIGTRNGLLAPRTRPRRPGEEPVPQSYSSEQWMAQLQEYSDTIDTDMKTSALAIASLFMENTRKLGINAAQTMNRIVRNRMYNVAESGHTVADGAQVGVTALRVKRLNGFTKARSSSGSVVRFNDVSSANPLTINVEGVGTRSVIGFTPDTAGDEVGPGTLTLSAVVTVNDRDAITSIDATKWVVPNHDYTSALSIDDIGASDYISSAAIRKMVANLRQDNVPVHPDGHFHCHLSPASEATLMRDPEIQRMQIGNIDNYLYSEMVIAKAAGTLFVRNNECPNQGTVYPYDGTYSAEDSFAGELSNAGSVEVERALFTGFGGIVEYAKDMSDLISEAGLNGTVSAVQTSQNGMEVTADGVRLIFRAPLNRTQDVVSTSWQFIGDWPCATDSVSGRVEVTGGTSRFKRMRVLAHAVQL